MKQRVLIPIILLLLVFCVSASWDVDLDLPEESEISINEGDTVDFICSINEASQVKNITLKLTKGTEEIKDIDISLNNIGYGIEAYFSKTISSSGIWTWTCYTDSYTSSESKTITVNAVNSPPEITCTIPNQTKSFIDLESIEWSIDLSACKTDNEDLSEDLIWTVEDIESSFCDVQIISGNVAKFIPSNYGSHTVKFVLTDSGELNDIQDVKITINVGTSSCTDTIWSPPTSDYCEGETFTQTSDCDNIRIATGTKSCSSECTEDWSCDSWSDCEDDEKTRDCTDDNDCGTTDDKPSESKSCSSSITSSGEYTLEITKSTPSYNNIKLKPGEKREFKITTNEDGDIVWKIDNKKISEDSKSFIYKPTSIDIGSHIITVMVTSETNDNDRDTKTWDVEVLEDKPESLCGNDKIDENETCLTCPEDVTCQKKEYCDEGICKEKQLNLITGFFIGTKDFVVQQWYYPTLIVSLILLLIIMAKILKISKKSKKQEFLPEFAEKLTWKQRLRRRIRNWDKKRKIKKDNKDILKNIKVEKKENIKALAPGIESIIAFVNQRVQEGSPKKVIKRALKQKGWNRKQIKQAFKKIKNDSEKSNKGDQSLSR